MPQSLSQVLLHIVFSTKNRESLIDATIQPLLHAYLAGVGRTHKCEMFRVGGVEDHVHLAASLHRTVTQSDLIEALKVSSSKWMKEQHEKYREFHWQRGYGIFSIGMSGLDGLIRYIDTQAEHHRKTSFQDEMRVFYAKYKVPFDEAYVWD